MQAHHHPDLIEGTGRLEAFSDGVIAIIVTLLIFEVHVPTLVDASIPGVLAALFGMAPKIVSFAVSFFTVAIFWVNHHHFYSRVEHSDWRLLWYNNLLLFFLTIVPFTTAFIGDYPTNPVVVSIYAGNLCLAGIGFMLMGRHVFFKSNLMDASVPLNERRREFQRSWWGILLYGLAGIVAFVFVYLALVILAIIPFIYVVPYLMQQD